uniref:G-protein coupled receptors family 1 profile domain-containing protein n=1 Tax=Clytia hemisphaerica TaxID=252671 RepID=A0A7M5X3I8_9CNID
KFQRKYFLIRNSMKNTTHAKNCTTVPMEAGPSIIFVVLIAIILSLLNVIALVVIFSTCCKGLKKKFFSKFPIICLLVGSTIKGAIADPLYIYKILLFPESHSEPKWLCDSSRFLRIFSSHLMKINIMSLTLQRLYAISKSSKKSSTKCLVWFGRILYFIYMISPIGIDIVPFFEHPRRKHHCNYVPNRHWVISVEVVYSIIPLTIAFLSQIAIIYQAYKQAKAGDEILNDQEGQPLRRNNESNIRRKDVKFTFKSIASLKLIVTSGIFLFCWFSLSVF